MTHQMNLKSRIFSTDPNLTLLFFQHRILQKVNTKVQVQKYEKDVNVSKVLQKHDKDLMLSWADDYQIRRLDVTMKYRLQMVKHQEHSFKSNGNVQVRVVY